MSHLPARQEASKFGLFLQPDDFPRAPHGSRNLVQMFRIALRSAWVIAVFAVVVAAIAAIVVYRLPRVYRASASLRIDDRTPSFPDVFRDASSGTELVTKWRS